MAEPTLVNGQITDSVTQSNVNVIGSSPAVAVQSLYQSASNAMGIAMHNAVSQQQNSNNLSTAIVSSCVETILNKTNA